MTHERTITHSLRIGWLEGIPSAIMLGITEYYVVPFGLFLQATTRQIGWLVALPQLLGACAGAWAVTAVDLVGSRRRFLVRAVALQAALLVPLAALGLWAFPGRVWWLIAGMMGFRVLMSLIGPAWGALMSDYLPPERRGRYFGGRARAVGAAQLGGMAIGAVLLFLTKQRAPALGFCAIFLIAAAARAVSARYLSQLIDLAPAHATDASFGFLAFLRRLQESNFVRFTLYVAGITFATHLAAPYFSVFMLRDLHFNYLTYMAVHLASLAMSLLALPIWGRHADVVGNARVLKTTGLLVPLLPLAWIVTANPALLMINEGLSGFIWGGFNLCATNFVYDAVTPAKRLRGLGYFNLINGMAMCAGAALGAHVAEWLGSPHNAHLLWGVLPPINGSSLLMLFALSGALRLLAHCLLARHFEEVRASSRRVSSRELFFSVVGIRPLWGEHQDSPLPSLRRD